MEGQLLERITVTDFAAICGVTEKTVYSWLKDKRKGTPEKDKHGRFDQLEVLEWASKRAMRTVRLVK